MLKLVEFLPLTRIPFRLVLKFQIITLQNNSSHEGSGARRATASTSNVMTVGSHASHILELKQVRSNNKLLIAFSIYNYTSTIHFDMAPSFEVNNLRSASLRQESHVICIYRK